MSGTKLGNYRLQMSRDGLIAYQQDIPMTIRFNRQETEDMLHEQIDFSKHDYFCEVAHLEISNECNLNCVYCYNTNKNGFNLDTHSWKSIIANLARAGVFQVSFGGGEPTMRSDLIELAIHVHKLGMNLGMTTNGIKIPNMDAPDLKKYFKQINVSWHQNENVVRAALNFLANNSIPRGINYAFSKEMAKDNDTVKALAKEFNAELLYLVYKPVIWDVQNQIEPKDVYAAAKKAANEGLLVAVDGPCVNKCLMKRKFVDVNYNGAVYPCSFVRRPMGNLLYHSFTDIWKSKGEQEECPYVDLKKEEESGS